MQSERLLASEYERLKAALEHIASLNGQPTSQDIAHMTLRASP